MSLKLKFFQKAIIILIVIFLASGCEKDGSQSTEQAAEKDSKISKKVSVPLKKEEAAPVVDDEEIVEDSDKANAETVSENEISDKKEDETSSDTSEKKEKQDSAETAEKTDDKEEKKSKESEVTDTYDKEKADEASDSFIKDLLNASADTDEERIQEEIKKLYSGEGRIDPFSPLIKEKEEEEPEEEESDKPSRPKTPLEKLDLSQLELVAVISSPDGKTAILEESSGKGYIVEKGTYVGLNSGQISKIESDRLIINETVKNISGKSVTREKILKIQKPFGE
ncbi:MAG: pilus assembly protein PilP [Thermodesulfobacteriota bacterium]